MASMTEYRVGAQIQEFGNYLWKCTAEVQENDPNSQLAIVLETLHEEYETMFKEIRSL